MKILYFFNYQSGTCCSNPILIWYASFKCQHFSSSLVFFRNIHPCHHRTVFQFWYASCGPCCCWFRSQTSSGTIVWWVWSYLNSSNPRNVRGRSHRPCSWWFWNYNSSHSWGLWGNFNSSYSRWFWSNHNTFIRRLRNISSTIFNWFRNYW